jgi:hypothetical protein
MKTSIMALVSLALGFIAWPTLADDTDGGADSFESTPADASSEDDGARDSVDASTDDGAQDDSSGVVPIACDGALCDTSNGSGCSMARWGKPADGEIAVAWSALLIVLQRQRARARGAK